MKKTLSFIFLLAALQFSAQTYYPFATDSAVWTVVEYGYGTTPPQTGTWHYGLAGDTIFNGLLYSKLYVNQGSLGSINPEPVFNLQTANYEGAIREDSAKKIWFRKWSDTLEILRYDFSLNVGDTFCFNNEPCGIQCHQVAAVDSILINGTYRRQIHFYYGGQSETWIEGIGSIVGAWEFFWCFVGNIEFTLNCYSENGLAIYGACNYPTGKKENLMSENDFVIFPNPANGIVAIDLTKLKGSTQLEILSVDGKLQKYYQIAENTKQQTLDLNELQPGIYFCRIKQNEKIIGVRKLILLSQK